MLRIPTLPLGSRRLLRLCAHAIAALTLAACATPPESDAPGSSGTVPTQAAARKAKGAKAQAAPPGAAGEGAGNWNLFGLGSDDNGMGIGKQGSLDGLRADLGTFEQRGTASWYGKGFHGRKTANGERFDMHSMTAAHPSLPLDSWVLVRNLRNNKVAVLRINDRGPYHGNRVLDVSFSAARRLGFVDRGSTQVEIRRLSRTEVAAIGPQLEAGGTEAGDGTGADDMALPDTANALAPAQPKKAARPAAKRKRH